LFALPCCIEDLIWMKNLLLVRHGHAAEGRDDHERALTPHGERAAVRAGKNLAEAHCEPELALLSTAVRVTQTWEHIQIQLSTNCRVEAQRSLYLGGRDSIHTQLVSIPDSVECALVVAHNPGISQLASWLIAESPADLVERLQRGFAPGEVASLTLRVTAWSDVGTRCADISGYWE
jgi:phosphohistidine phosphatase